MEKSKRGRPRKYEKDGRQTAYEIKKKSENAKNVGVYLSASSVEALENWKVVSGLNTTELINLILTNSLERPRLFLELIQVDYKERLNRLEQLAKLTEKIKGDVFDEDDDIDVLGQIEPEDVKAFKAQNKL